MSDAENTDRNSVAKWGSIFACVVIVVLLAVLAFATVTPERWFLAPIWGAGFFMVLALSWRLAFGGAIYQWTGRKYRLRFGWPPVYEDKTPGNFIG